MSGETEVKIMGIGFGQDKLTFLSEFMKDWPHKLEKIRYIEFLETKTDKYID